MAADEIQEIFEAAQDRFKPGRVDRELSFYFKFGASAAEKWTVWIGPEKCEFKQGKHVEVADCVVKTEAKFFLKMVKQGYKPGAMDFMRGKIGSNDPFLLKELQKALDL